MGRAGAAVGSAVFFALAPGVVAGVVPWWLTGWEATDLPGWWLPLRVAGVVLLVAGAGVLVHAFARFVAEGVGTPAPVAPTRELVVGGLYRYVRNPMYLAVLAAIAGQALVLGRLVLVPYAAVVAAAFVAFVRGLRGADPGLAVRRSLPGLPGGRARLVAPPAPLAAGRGRLGVSQCHLPTLRHPLATADGTWPFVSPGPSGRFMASGRRGIGSADGFATCSGECEGPR